MFKKEAKKYRENLFQELADKIQQGYNCKELSDIELAWQKGAEFGYNKANEWHFVKDGDLPKDENFKLCISTRGVCYIAKYEEIIGTWTNQEYKDVCCPVAWKEIVPPKEPKDCRKCKHLSKGTRGVCVLEGTCNNYDNYEEVEKWI